MDNVAIRPARERADLFNEAGTRRGLATAIIEKDFWVCGTLKRLFTLPGNDNPGLGSSRVALPCPGSITSFGDSPKTSICHSTVAILAIQATVIQKQRKADQLIEDLRARVERHIAQSLMPRLRSVIGAALGSSAKSWELAIDSADPETVSFRYLSSLAQAAYAGMAYVNPVVRLELGARGDPWPTGRHEIMSYVAEEFPDIFAEPTCSIVALAVERTFWEKATILHAEYHRPDNRPIGDKQSRHYDDIAMLSESDYGDRALGQLDLLARVAHHKSVFFRSGWAHYETAGPGTLRLTPSQERLAELSADYAKMRPMMFDRAPPRFSHIMNTIADLERRINTGGTK